MFKNLQESISALKIDKSQEIPISSYSQSKTVKASVQSKKLVNVIKYLYILKYNIYLNLD